ncbi:MAG: ECF transporter S component [Clostridia bacterium]|nr:ECF transporter S component [Clostridia bacterium]
MKLDRNMKRAILFFVLILLAAMLGQPFAHGYMHPADPLVLLAAIFLPAPHALIACGAASMAADLFKGYMILAPITLLIKLLMVWAAKKLYGAKLAKNHPEMLASFAALIPIPCYYLAELIFQLIQKSGMDAFTLAAETLPKNLIQGFASLLLFILIHDLCKSFHGGLALARKKQKEEQEND